MEHCELRENVEHGLNEALRDIVGASYIPVLYCAEQLVHGTNHMLICKQTLETAQLEEYLTKIILHEPLPADMAHPLYRVNLLIYFEAHLNFGALWFGGMDKSSVTAKG